LCFGKAIGGIHRQAIIQENNGTGWNFSGRGGKFFFQAPFGNKPKGSQEGGKQAGKAEESPEPTGGAAECNQDEEEEGGEGKKEEKRNEFNSLPPSGQG